MTTIMMSEVPVVDRETVQVVEVLLHVEDPEPSIASVPGDVVVLEDGLVVELVDELDDERVVVLEDELVVELDDVVTMLPASYVLSMN